MKRCGSTLCGKPIILLPTKWNGLWWHRACLLKFQADTARPATKRRQVR